MKVVKAIGKIIAFLIMAITAFFAIVGKPLYKWFAETSGVTFEEIIYTIKSPMQGADTHILREAVVRCIPAFLVFIVVLALILFLMRINKHLVTDIKIGIEKKQFRINVISVTLVFIFLINVLGTRATFEKADEALKLRDYIDSVTKETHIYDDYYVKPDIDAITAEKGKNLIYIIIESMETTYASVDVGGRQPENNYIPNLTELANDNVSFSNTDKLGGFHVTTHTGWTMAGILASSAGIPFSFPIEGNEDFGNREAFAKGTITLGDILNEKGYYQEFLCGSDATFAGRRAYFEQHGNYDIFDWNSAVEKGYIREEDKVWWGLEDKNLYKIAKDELTRMSQQDKPFNLTMLTVDMHHVDGWICDECGNEYPERLANVVACADRLAFKFIEWCKEQPWYEDTVIVIQGDHPRMDKSLVDGVERYDRTVYNCFVNAAVNPDHERKINREFTTMDMYPTILGAMGFTMPGNRLGLGTNLFSDTPTLAEQLGFDYVNDETAKYSSYFIREFS